MEIESFYRDKVVLVTGAAGTVGRALVARLAEMGPKEIRALDNDESELFFLGQDYAHVGLVALLGDLRDRRKLDKSFRGVDVVLHAGALKHVPLCEHDPMEAVQTNVLGMQNVIDAAIAAGVERVIFTSSDKAVNPTSVMGTSKLMGEQLMRAANVMADAGAHQVFSSTRFGNVLGSRGSVVPLFREQIRRGGPITLTDRDMTRFVMTLEEAAHLVLEAGVLARGGEVFITKMGVLRIEDLAQAMIDELAPQFGHDPAAIEIKEIGSRPGEKLYEELMNTEETRRSLELERHFAVLPALRNLYREVEYDYPGILSTVVDNPYNSANEPAMSPAEVRAYMKSTGLLAAD